jgi:hypothetical protein
MAFAKKETYETVIVEASTLVITRVYCGEYVVTGGDDGQVYVATFADRVLAQAFLEWMQQTNNSCHGERAVTLENNG